MAISPTPSISDEDQVHQATNVYLSKQKHKQESLKTSFKAVEPCAVCGDLASGIHFSVFGHTKKWGPKHRFSLWPLRSGPAMAAKRSFGELSSRFLRMAKFGHNPWPQIAE
jgi:hypothetical protein